MDDYFFESHVLACKTVTEPTSFLEIFNYSDGETHYDKGKLDDSEIENFLNQTGVFEPPKKAPGVTIISGMRLILQLNATQPETFTSQYISFKHSEYISMVRKLHLPFRAIEGSSAVGPFFWSSLDTDEGEIGDATDENANPRLHLVFRKSDVRKKGLTRGWEIMLSHEFRTGMTTGYAKGTASSKLEVIIDQHLRACASLVGHPLLLPTIIAGHELDNTMDERQRNTRQELRRLEHAITFRDEIDPKERFLHVDLDQMNQSLVECHGQVLWKRPQAYMEMLDQMRRAMSRFQETRRALRNAGRLATPQLADPAVERALNRLHRSMLGRFEFYYQKLKGVQHYAYTTISRLNVQLGALYNIIAQRESKLNFEMAHHQRLLALAAKRDSQSMKALSIVGAVFLPATYVASLFSMTFFNFQNDDGTSPAVTSTLWIYFAITVPLTMLVLGVWFWWDKRREKKFTDEEKAIEKAKPNLENDFVTSLVEKRTGFNSLNSMDTKRWETM